MALVACARRRRRKRLAIGALPGAPQDRKTLPVFFFTDLATGEPFGSNPLPDPSTSVS